jgi:hypothetical protein
VAADGNIPPPRESGLGVRGDAVAMPRPGPAKAPHRPRLEERCPRRLAARHAAAAVVRDWMRRRSVSTQDLADICDESAGTMHDRLTGEKPLPVEVLVLLDKRARKHVFELLSDVEIDVAAA